MMPRPMSPVAISDDEVDAMDLEEPSPLTAERFLWIGANLSSIKGDANTRRCSQPKGISIGAESECKEIEAGTFRTLPYSDEPKPGNAESGAFETKKSGHSKWAKTPQDGGWKPSACTDPRATPESYRDLEEAP
ncbi:hypothetical protein BGZ67_006934 [Mortierella alpina]|nr:hypothetical protein BGZ67_006934 [Mortierella alpina]